MVDDQISQESPSATLPSCMEGKRVAVCELETLDFIRFLGH